jgi:MFS family permease
MPDRPHLPDSAAAPFPLWPLLATTAMQTFATMAAYSVPALAPAIARDLHVDGALTGYFVSVVYGVGIVSSLLAAGLIHRLGAVRVCQGVLAAALAMLLISASGSLAALALGAVALGTAYGAAAPVSTHLLVPRTPPAIVNLVLSIRQIGVPLGGVLGALLLPPLALRIGWQSSLLLLALPVAILLLLLEVPRRRWDAGAGSGAARGVGALRQSASLLAGSAELRRLTLASFVFSGVQLCFVAFTTVQLTSRASFDLVAAGQALAAYQLSGVISRPIWGWLADTRVAARRLLALQGVLMGLAAAVAGHFGPAWPVPLVLLTCAVAGLSASGYTGIAYAEFARMGGARRTEATGLGSAAMFTGVLILPSLAALLVTGSGSYVIAYGAVGAAALLAGLMLGFGAPGPRRGGGAP